MNERAWSSTRTLPFGEWTQIFRTERLTVALLDRLTHRAQILEMNGKSYRLKSAMDRQAQRRCRLKTEPVVGNGLRSVDRVFHNL